MSKPHAATTKMERDILEALLKQRSNKDIALHLDTSQTAVKAAIRVLCAKFGVTNRTQLARLRLNRTPGFEL
jgi:DNA-binding NarL/FixJ family response regulator